MIKDGKGGANTNLSGLKFEKRIDVKTAFEQIPGYEVNQNNEVYFEGEKVAELYPKYSFYKKLLAKYGIKWQEIVVKRLVPDDTIFVLHHNTLYIIEKKFQAGSGSVDEKLQTADFKLKQYRKLLAKAEIRVEVIYVLNNWFREYKYKDVLEYIDSTGCSYFIEKLPLKKLGLPSPKESS